jgi:hypothetical protein
MGEVIRFTFWPFLLLLVVVALLACYTWREEL